MTISLDVQNVTKSFGSLKALDNVTFKLKGAIINGLIGPNGSGKTVLINVITKVPYGPDSGKNFFNGTRIDTLKPSQISKLGIARTFQTIAFFSSLTVEQHLLVGVNSIGSNLEVLNEALKLTDLQEKKIIKADKLSVFELKKLMIATALSLDPKLILVDEPLSGLSEEEVLHMLKILKRINETGRAILVIEHKIDEIVDLCDKLLVLHLGKVIADGKPEEVINKKEVLMAYFGGVEYAKS